MIYINSFFKILIISVLMHLTFCFKNNNQDNLTTISKPDFTVKRGVNISHWLSQSNKNEEERLNYFSEEDMKLIASLGYDHIRLPIDEKNMWDENGIKDTLAFQSLHSAIYWAKNNDLRVIVDLHIVRAHYFNNEYNPLWDDVTEQQKFVNLWRQLSLELKKYPNGLIAYEILNEPVANNAKDWNDLLSETIKEIRLNEPFRTIVLGSNKWQSVDTFQNLKIPEEDSNIILSFHFYSPHVFTHYKAPWSKIGFYNGPIKYPGISINKEDLKEYTKEQISLLEDNVSYSKDFFQDKMQSAIQIAKEYNLQLYCGEFGCFPSTPNKDRMQWYSDIISVFNENNIAWANWDYQGGFGIIDSKTGVINKELIEVLIKDN
ncbi:endoglucanase [Flaviramulus basaltis]|uniref:Endoglucanase n=1 Tax=Flaviramulus basaltis TaxID=369401 RepID=A0A1K2IRH2_9FLAO|nr:cellulase family glycosylhydrolase [Flaviramulus basaltis]SFZ95041.1 endoglucanase [Flaviramulus basaltis]